LARQKLGQHFLISDKVLNRIAEAGCGSGVPFAVEIGPGKGALTAKLLPLTEKLIAVELDADLIGFLQSRFGQNTHFEVLHRDALHAPFAQWSGAVVLGNLPYYVATPIVERIARLMPSFPRAIFLVQREVAERIAAVPGSRDYGYLSVLIQHFCRAKLLFRVAPGCFQPPPKVDSAVIELMPHVAPLEPDLGEDFVKFLGMCFHMKRKTLRNNLAARYSREMLDQHPETANRAEQMPLDALKVLYRSLR
jgi:16S rRNA (adenine1518-N6/adenine1519-N6)-dimethyltransferase